VAPRSQRLRAWLLAHSAGASTPPINLDINRRIFNSTVQATEQVTLHETEYLATWGAAAEATAGTAVRGDDVSPPASGTFAAVLATHWLLASLLLIAGCCCCCRHYYSMWINTSGALWITSDAAQAAGYGGGRRRRRSSPGASTTAASTTVADLETNHHEDVEEDGSGVAWDEATRSLLRERDASSAPSDHPSHHPSHQPAHQHPPTTRPAASCAPSKALKLLGVTEAEVTAEARSSDVHSSDVHSSDVHSHHSPRASASRSSSPLDGCVAIWRMIRWAPSRCSWFCHECMDIGDHMPMPGTVAGFERSQSYVRFTAARPASLSDDEDEGEDEGASQIAQTCDIMDFGRDLV
jgi:hypothetical protein